MTTLLLNINDVKTLSTIFRKKNYFLISVQNDRWCAVMHSKVTEKCSSLRFFLEFYRKSSARCDRCHKIKTIILAPLL